MAIARAAAAIAAAAATASASASALAAASAYPPGHGLASESAIRGGSPGLTEAVPAATGRNTKNKRGGGTQGCPE
jgi:hypothetical protein